MAEEKLSEDIFGPLDIEEAKDKFRDGEIQSLEINKDLETGETKATVIEKASVVVNLTTEQVLEVDMKRLVGIDVESKKCQAELDNINADAEAHLVAVGLDVIRDENIKKKADLKNQYNELKEDIGKRGLEISKKTKYTNKLPVPGVQIKKFTKEELEVDIAEAVKWAIENNHFKLMTILADSYLDVLKTGVLEGQPGAINDATEYKAFISLKPYQEKK